MLRRAVIPDVPRLDEIERDAFGVHAAGVADELARSWARVYVAVADADVIEGYVIAWRVADEVEVIQVATDAQARRRGRARALLEHTFAEARAEGAVRALLEVRPSNVAAVTLYRAMGFVELSRRARYYNDGEDALVMSLVFG